MTRSHKAPSRQARFTASVRAKAERDGVHFGAALPDAKAKAVANKNNNFDNPGVSVKRHGRNGAEWNGGQFICGPQVDEHNPTSQREVIDEDEDARSTQQEDKDVHPSTEMTVAILEIARPAKIKILRNQFEFVPRSVDIRVAEDEYDIVSTISTSLFSEEGWEDIYDDTQQPG